MSDEELIRRGDAQRAVNLALCKAPLKTKLDLLDALNDTKDAIAAMPAVTQPTPQEVVDAMKDAAAVAMKAREAALREAAAILRREIERVDAIAPERKATPHRHDQRKVSLSAVASEYEEIEQEILALIPKGAAE